MLAVLLYHVSDGTGGQILHEFARRGFYGVDVFFVLSGFLITRLLVDELDRSGTIVLRRFYIRRAFRLYPAFLSAIVLTFIAKAAMHRWREFEALASMLPYYVTYTMNIWSAFNFHEGMNQGLPLLQVWSLCIEEQFYLAWPLVLRALGRNRALRALYCTVAASILLRTLTYCLAPFESAEAFISYFTLTKLDTIGIGCILALSAEPLVHYPALYSRAAMWLYIVCAAPLLWWGTGSQWWYYTVGSSVMALAVAVIITALWLGGRCAITGVLASNVMVEIGRVSYGVYLFQFLAISATYHLVDEACTSSACLLRAWVLSGVLVIALSEVHFRTIEKYFLALRDRVFDEEGRMRWVAAGRSLRLRTAASRANDS